MSVTVPSDDRFDQPLDIANKACFHWGVRPMTTFADDSIEADFCNRTYHNLRADELRRNVWTMGCRIAFLRPIQTAGGPAPLPFANATNNTGITGLLTPAVWTTTATYLLGSIVSYNGLIYEAVQPVPANQEPDTQPTYWQEFFGTLAVTAWTLNGNTNNPLPWSSTTTYAAQESVLGSDGNIYTSLVNGNVGNDPTTDNGIHWQLIGPASGGSGYFDGELVYTQSGTTITIYRSLSTGNTDVPGDIPSWSASAQYVKGNYVVSGGVNYQSQIDFNLGQTPVAAWASGTTYATGNQVLATDGHLYTSLINSNIGNNPANDAFPSDWTDNGVAPWILKPSTQTDNQTGVNWLQLGSATLSALQVTWPVGSGPLDQVATRNVFLLPNGFLRMAPQDPKAGSSSYLGAPSGLAYRDWVINDKYLVSREVEPIALRFVADVRDVSRMDPMFCEMLALRIAFDGAERVTQDLGKKQAIGGAYKQFASDARVVNAIEQGPEEPPEDDYITARI